MSMYDRRSSNSNTNKSDDPPNSRLFVVANKSLMEKDFREAFEPFGRLEEVWVVKDRNTGDNKGVTFIKYSKTSEAAAALEALNGKTIGSIGRSIKVMLAASKDQAGSRVNDGNDEERCCRLFIKVPKSTTERELLDIFKEYGAVEYATMMKDKHTNENKGFAYIKYIKFSDAAKAFENCSREYKPVFAEPRNKNKGDDMGSYLNNMSNKVNNSMSNLRQFGGGGPSGGLRSMPPEAEGPNNYTRLTVMVPPFVPEDALWKLFDIVPGLDFFRLDIEGPRQRPERGVAKVRYTESKWAAHAYNKLHGFEFPPGNRLIVRPEFDYAPPKRSFAETQNSPIASSLNNLDRSQQAELLHLAETIAQASSLIKAAGIKSTDSLDANHFMGNQDICNVPLPGPKPFAGIDEPVAARCFIVCYPTPPPSTVLKEVFSRFGDLIHVYMLPGKNCGYAKYASTKAAADAIKVLHGAEVCGSRLKVLEAEERRDDVAVKRARMEVQEDCDRL